MSTDTAAIGISENIQKIHTQALRFSQDFKSSQINLINILEEIDREKVFSFLGYKNLFEYCGKALGLSDDVTYNLTSVMRKSKIVPELKMAIESGEITVSKARRIVPVITKENKQVWLEKAKELSKNQLEKEIAKACPKAEVKERVRYIQEDRLEMKVTISEELLKKLKRIQDLESKRLRKVVSIEEALVRACSVCLEKLDPVEKAKRAAAKLLVKEEALEGGLFQPGASGIKTVMVGPGRLVNKSPSTSALAKKSPQEKVQIPFMRQPLPANLKHQVNLRDQGKCIQKDLLGELCGESRWTKIHHVIPISHGGINELVNLQTLCSSHHRMLHEPH